MRALSLLDGEQPGEMRKSSVLHRVNHSNFLSQISRLESQEQEQEQEKEKKSSV